MPIVFAEINDRIDMQNSLCGLRTDGVWDAHTSSVPSLRLPNSTTPKCLHQLDLHALDGIEVCCAAGSALHMLEECGQAHKVPLVTAASSVGASVKSGTMRSRVMSGALEVHFEGFICIKDEVTGEAHVRFGDSWGWGGNPLASEPSEGVVDDDTGRVAVTNQPEDAVMLQAWCILALPFFEVPHQGTRFVKAVTTERAKDVVSAMPVGHRVLRQWKSAIFCMKCECRFG